MMCLITIFWVLMEVGVDGGGVLVSDLLLLLIDAVEPIGLQLHLSGDSAQLIVGAGNSVGLPAGPPVPHRAGNDLEKPPFALIA